MQLYARQSPICIWLPCVGYAETVRRGSDASALCPSRQGRHQRVRPAPWRPQFGQKTLAARPNQELEPRAAVRRSTLVLRCATMIENATCFELSLRIRYQINSACRSTRPSRQVAAPLTTVHMTVVLPHTSANCLHCSPQRACAGADRVQRGAGAFGCGLMAHARRRAGHGYASCLLSAEWRNSFCDLLRCRCGQSPDEVCLADIREAIEACCFT